MSTPSATQTSSETPASSAADPNLLWSDEFDGDAIDETKWGYNIGTGDNGWGNGEWEYYTDRAENVYVKDGLLHIRANLETNADDIANKFGGQKYTSARIITQNKFTFAYGTVEARIALPAGKGIWPAFWMLGENIDKVSWPACGEIDIIEAINDENVIYGTHHWAHEGTHAQYGNSTKQHFDGHYDLDITEFHVYKMTWDKNAISMYVDDFMYQKIDIADAAGEMGTFHKPFFFILNVAVGGTWPGFDIDDSQFPTEMLVDYIRVYKN
ncbi:glycoside hydrolase family 16 protein [Fibrobacter sp.]|uniref:glycoside hydrolase family 16 protein n=1 Tax=Fibrobacter sp. TaxID=35828 RepID=UPI00388EB091